MTPRVVLDTNVFISALLFEGGTSRLVSLWQKGVFTYLLSRSILDEYIRVLSYPKFQLSDSEVRNLIQEDLLPHVKVVREREIKVTRLKDRDDEKFLKTALLGKAHYLVTGDQELLALEKERQCQILRPSDFIKRLTVLKPS